MTDLTLPHIVVHRHEQCCAHCGHIETYTHIYECITVGRAKRLMPLTAPPGTLPIVHIAMPRKVIPLCCSCVDEAVQPDAEAHARWAQTLARKSPNAPAPSHVTSSRNSTIDDLE